MNLEEIAIYRNNQVLRHESINSEEYHFINDLKYSGIMGIEEYERDSFIEHVLGVEVRDNSIVKLKIQNHYLPHLPKSMNNLKNLEELQLYNNQLKFIPYFLEFKKLKYLNIRQNPLVSYALSFLSEMKSLEKLELNDTIDVRESNEKISFPAILNISNLKELHLNRNNFSSLPDNFGDIINLENLRITNNKLTCLPNSFGNLTKLKNLNLKENQIKYLPDTFGRLEKLENLDLCDNKLKRLPDSFCELKNLKNLSIVRNKIESLPDTFGRLMNLEKLTISNNNLNSLPETFGCLKKLNNLILFNNKLSHLPDSILLHNKIMNAISESSCFNENLFDSASQYFEKKDEVIEISELIVEGKDITHEQVQILGKYSCISRDFFTPDLIGALGEKNENNKENLKKIFSLFMDKVKVKDEELFL